MRKEDLQTLTLTGHIEVKKERRATVSKITGLCKQMTEERVGMIVKRKTLLKATNGIKLYFLYQLTEFFFEP